MNIDQINNTRIHSHIDKIVGQLDCILDGPNAVYISTPITSGKRFIDWYIEKGKHLNNKADDTYRTELYHDVIKVNIHENEEKIKKIRETIKQIIIDPTKLEVGEWEQEEYRYYWGKVIEKFIKKIIFFDGWEYSNGCCFEFLKAVKCNVECLDENLKPIYLKNALDKLDQSIKIMEANSLSTDYIEKIKHNLDIINTNNLVDKTLELSSSSHNLYFFPRNDKISNLKKDEILNQIAWTGNIAQFISFRPDTNKGLNQKYSRIAGYEPNYIFPSVRRGIEHLINNTPDHTVNIRSYSGKEFKGNPLIYGISNVDEVLGRLNDLSSRGLCCIVNETIDIEDGGISGVALNNVIEFSPGDTPKCVDKPGTCRLPRNIGIHLLTKVYGFRPTLNFSPEYRVEFSIHPIRRGFLHNHTIIWEIEHFGKSVNEFKINWPNNFSRFIGDKVYGILLADCIDMPVPFTQVFPRKIAPFSVGINTGTNEYWIRTCPATPEPGYYPTEFGWRDPFDLISEQVRRSEINNIKTPIMSILSQESVAPVWSGSLVPGATINRPIVEGVKGRGDKFMLGERRDNLPEKVIIAVNKLFMKAYDFFGPVSLEWVYDSEIAWCVQMHKSEEVLFSSDIIVHSDNEMIDYVEFHTEKGLNELRKLIELIKDESKGIKLIGDIGITSHFGDLLRKARIPSKIQRYFNNS